MEVTEEHKKVLEQRIVEAMMTGLDQDVITSDELPDIADFVLDKIDQLKTQDELMQFLRELSGKWHIFSQILVIESGEVKEHIEHKVASNVLDLVRAGKVDDAISLAKSATAATTAAQGA